MAPNCVVCGKSAARDGVTMHGFPRDVEVCRRWIRFVRLNYRGFETPSKSEVICSEHFESHCFNTNPVRESLGYKTRKVVLSGMIPTLNPFPDHKRVKKFPTEPSKEVSNDDVVVKDEATSQPKEGEEEESASSSSAMVGCIEKNFLPIECEYTVPHELNQLIVEPPMAFMRRKSASGETIQAIPRANIIDLHDKSIQSDIVVPKFDKQLQCDILESPAQIQKKKKKKEKNVSTPAKMQDRIFTVTDSCLMELFSLCPHCLSRNCKAQITNINVTIVQITQDCPECGHKRVWDSQPQMQSKSGILSEQNINSNNTDHRAMFLS